MFKKIVFLWLLVLAQLGQAGVMDQFVDKQDRDYQSIRGLQIRLPGSKPLPEEGSSRAEMLLALAELAGRAAATQDDKSMDYKAKDYDALYSLLQKYRDELRALGVKSATLEKSVEALKQKVDSLENKLNGMLKYALDGMKIYGRQIGIYDDLLLTGGSLGSPAPDLHAGNSYRFRNAVLETDLTFSGTRGPISALAELDYKFYVETGWPGLSALGVRRLQAEFRLPVVIQVGDVDAHLTPLTLWRNEDVDPFDVEPFKSRTQRLLDDLALVDSSVKLRGFQLSSDLLLFEKQVIHLKGLFHAYGYGGSTIGYAGSYNPGGTYPALNNALLIPSYNTFLGAWQAETPLFSVLDLGYTGTMIRDATDSAFSNVSPLYTGSNAPVSTWIGQPIRGFDSQVHSGHTEIHLFGNSLKLAGEYAESLYSNPNYTRIFNDPIIGYQGYLTGSALLVQVKGKLSWLELEAAYRHVDSSFVSSPAQGRTQDTTTSQYGPFLHEQSQYNTQNGLYIDNYGNLINAGEDQFNRFLLPPQFAKSQGGAFVFNYLMPYNAATNASAPYGWATPNRSGEYVQASFNFLNGGLKPKILADYANQVIAYPVYPVATTNPAESYSLVGAGLEMDLKSLFGWPLSFSGGWMGQTISNGAWVNFASTRFNLGGDWTVFKDLHLFGGYKHIDYNGTLGQPLYGAYLDPVTGQMANLATALPTPLPSQAYPYQQNYDLWAVGLRYQLTELSSMELNYGSQFFWDALAEGQGIASHYELDQGFLKFLLAF